MRVRGIRLALLLGVALGALTPVRSARARPRAANDDPGARAAHERLAYRPVDGVQSPLILPPKPAPSRLAPSPIVWARGWRESASLPVSPDDSLRRLTRDPGPPELFEAARLAERLRHGALADSLWAALAGSRNPWTWDAVRALAHEAIARGAPARAESLVLATDTTGFTTGEQADLCLMGTRAAGAAGDPARLQMWSDALSARFPGTWAAARAFERRPELPRAQAAPVPGPGADSLAPLRERERVSEQALAWDSAFALQSRLAARGATEDRARAGILALALGRHARAESLLAGTTDDAGRFWSSVLLRGSDRAAGDSALRALAMQPGFGWYRVLARDSLGIAAPVAAPASLPGSGTWATRAARLIAAGDEAECIRMIHRGATDGPQGLARAGEAGRSPLDWCEAASLAYALGRLPLGIVLARAAPDLPGPLSPAFRAALVPFAYPPGLELTAPRAFADLAAAALDMAMLAALAWQESKFDTAARSASDARGLLQLKLATAAEVSNGTRWRVRRDRDLDRADVNLEVGARYFDRLLTHFRGDTLLAVAGYNGGPGAVSRWWQAGGAALVANGGMALVAELVLRPETEDYVKRVLGARAAYRALRPALAPAPW
ncbi:MAG TPA: transglycosylase SLT domain-containing protein [Candidatus Eisenbacteria bacterium]|nr:transglycosylase SLT domain-containing protein [Candidatus Eisenbacteria bacterium]